VGSRFTFTVVMLGLVMASLATLLLPNHVTWFQGLLGLGFGIAAMLRSARRIHDY
jgi:hypothetical protein